MENISHKYNGSQSGKIILVGAGPGDPELLTLKAVKALRTADVVVYDKLVSAEILDYIPHDAERIFVGKSRAVHTLNQDDINALLVTKATEGLTVVRLKGGDPFIFGRGGEELDAARAANIEVEIVPGITAALGCAADAAISLTHRDYADAVTFVTGQRRDLAGQNWRGLHGAGRTLVVYMGVKDAAHISAKLIAEGASANLPVAIVENGTRKSARTTRATLATLADCIALYGIQSPALLIIGDVAAFARANTTPLQALSPFQFALAAE
jgi:uroporphyrin-III C-methyltransferase